jgi:hypothetical protein
MMPEATALPHDIETMEPIVFYTDRPSPELVLEMHEEPGHPLEVSEPGMEEISTWVKELPGVDHLDPVKESTLEVQDNTVESNQTMEAKDKEDAKPKGAWDWKHVIESKGPEGFFMWVKQRIDSVPKHSGYDKAGLLRAVGYLEKLANEVSKAMREDLDGKLDADKIEHLLAQVEDGVERIHERIDKISKKKSRKKKSEFDQTGIVKEAQKLPTINGITIVVPLFISRIARVCLNGMVSAGHSLQDMYDQQCEKWDLTEREKAEVQQLIEDLGYGCVQNRGLIADKDSFIKEHGDFDYASNYKG